MRGELRRSAALRPGSRVRVVAPAGPIPPDLLAAGVALLRSWDLDVSVAPGLLDVHADLPYLAGTDAARAAALTEAWCDPDVDAVLCARGGYGCLRMLDLLDWDAMARTGPKTFAGSSDVTAIHHGLNTRLGVATLFTPMVASTAFTDDPVAAQKLRRALFDPSNDPITTRAAGALVGGKARGVTFGGNASLLAAVLGSPHADPPPPGSILLLEDVTEEPYRLDRIITQLARAGWFEQVAGIALGSWTQCGDLGEVRTLMADRLGGLGVPVGWELGFGHCAGQASVPLGVEAELDADAGTLTVPLPT